MPGALLHLYVLVRRMPLPELRCLPAAGRGSLDAARAAMRLAGEPELPRASSGPLPDRPAGEASRPAAGTAAGGQVVLVKMILTCWAVAGLRGCPAQTPIPVDRRSWAAHRLDCTSAAPRARVLCRNFLARLCRVEACARAQASSRCGRAAQRCASRSPPCRS